MTRTDDDGRQLLDADLRIEEPVDGLTIHVRGDDHDPGEARGVRLLLRNECFTLKTTLTPTEAVRVGNELLDAASGQGGFTGP